VGRVGRWRGRDKRFRNASEKRSENRKKFGGSGDVGRIREVFNRGVKVDMTHKMVFVQG
jgi:hypothetical protein